MGEVACRWVYEFGEFRLDACRRVLSTAADGVRIPIPPKAFDVALYLVQHAGELIPKERLLADLWPGQVVEENSLTQVISEFRRALGESRGDNRYVVTVPRRGYQFVAEAVRVAIPQAVPTVPDRSVAVLPFVNPGHATEDELLAAGIPGSILHRLAAVRGLWLVAPTSSFALRGQDGDARLIGRRLGARYLLAGSVEHLGSHLRVTAQLIDAADGSQVWSMRFDRTAVDVFALEDDVAQQVANAVCCSLLGTAADVNAAALSVAAQGDA